MPLAAARATMTWEPRIRTAGAREALTAIAVMLVALVAVAVGLHGKSRAIAYPEDDAIYPKGEKKDRQEIVRFMERTVMPWARVALAPDHGVIGTSHVRHLPRCPTGAERLAHAGSRDAATARDPRGRLGALRRRHGRADAQRDLRLRRPPPTTWSAPLTCERWSCPAWLPSSTVPPTISLERTEYNREQFAFGCYHCHKVK